MRGTGTGGHEARESSPIRNHPSSSPSLRSSRSSSSRSSSSASKNAPSSPTTRSSASSPSPVKAQPTNKRKSSRRFENEKMALLVKNFELGFSLFDFFQCFLFLRKGNVFHLPNRLILAGEARNLTYACAAQPSETTTTVDIKYTPTKGISNGEVYQKMDSLKQHDISYILWASDHRRCLYVPPTATHTSGREEKVPLKHLLWIQNISLCYLGPLFGQYPQLRFS